MVFSSNVIVHIHTHTHTDTLNAWFFPFTSLLNEQLNDDKNFLFYFHIIFYFFSCAELKNFSFFFVKLKLSLKTHAEIFSSEIIFDRFRVFCHKVCNHNQFGNIILACIMLSSVMLAAENPMDANADRNLVRRMFF